jgi:hypothetical protein
MTFENRFDLPIGLRNNNPGNLRPTGERWQGMTGTAGGFMKFDTMQNGVRAFFVELHTDMTRGKNTLRKRVGEYAPPTENNTASYLNQMVQLTGFKPDDILPSTREAAVKLFKAHARIENGARAAAMIPDAIIMQGIDAMPAAKRNFFTLPASACPCCCRPY